MKQIFFKTVRSNGDSVWAVGRFKRNYKVGQRYRFSKKFPAHVFTAESINVYPAVHTDGSIDFEVVYHYRAEAGGGNRVLICYGEVKCEVVPAFPIQCDWNFLNIHYHSKSKRTSTDFVVIGEIALPKSYNGVPPSENPPYKVKVLNYAASKVK